MRAFKIKETSKTRNVQSVAIFTRRRSVFGDVLDPNIDTAATRSNAIHHQCKMKLFDLK